jgi:hypothetical protein
MKFSEIVGSLVSPSPSLPDSRDLKDNLHAAVSYTIDATMGGEESGSSGMHNLSGSCSSKSSNLSANSMPYNVNMNDYIRKDSIPCYNCNFP